MTPKHLLYPLATAIVHRGYEAQWSETAKSFLSSDRPYAYCAVVERKEVSKELFKIRDVINESGGLPNGTTLSSYLETSKRN